MLEIYQKVYQSDYFREVKGLARMKKTADTGSVTKIERPSYTGKTVYMIPKRGGGLMPVNGRFEKSKMGDMVVNVLCHDDDKNPPQDMTRR